MQGQRVSIQRRMLKCTKCKQLKDVDDFHLQSCMKTRRQRWCKECRNTHMTRLRAMKRAGQRASGGFNTAERPAERPADCEGATSSMESDGDHLYLLQYPWDQSWDHSPIKVGRARDVAARVRSLESGHNFRLQVLTNLPWPGEVGAQGACVVVRTQSRRRAGSGVVHRNHAASIGSDRLLRSFQATRRSGVIETPPYLSCNLPKQTSKIGTSEKF